MNTEQIEVRTWSVVVLTLNFILFGSVAAILYAVMFVEHDLERISPIDQQFLAILKDIMLLCIGAVGGLVGRKGAYAAANFVAKEKDDAPLGPLLEVGGKILDRVLPDPAAAEAAKRELAKLEQDGELAKMAQQTKLFELNVENTKSAREMQVATRSRIPAVLSIVTVAGFFGLLVGSALGYMTLTGSDVMMLLLGVLARETASVYNFWLGSSNSSQQKDLMKK